MAWLQYNLPGLNRPASFVLPSLCLRLARELARSGKIGKRSASSRKLFYLRDPWPSESAVTVIKANPKNWTQLCDLVSFRTSFQDPITTDVTGPLQGQGAGESDWKSGASDLVIESEIWWTVLFRQQSIFMTLTSLLKDCVAAPHGMMT